VHGISCWLDVPLPLALQRIVDVSSRPLIAIDDALERRAFFERRRAAYALADLRVDASSGSASRLALAVDERRRAILH
jgi:shikimate kinase